MTDEKVNEVGEKVVDRLTEKDLDRRWTAATQVEEWKKRQQESRSIETLTMLPGDGSKPWHRRKKEPDRAWSFFEAFLGMGPARSLAGLAKETNTSLGSIRNWSATYAWLTRARDYDEAMQLRARELSADDAEELSRKHAQALEEMRERGLELIYAEGGTPRDGANMLKTAISYERLMMGEASARLDIKKATWDLTKLDDDEMEILFGLLAKIPGVLDK